MNRFSPFTLITHPDYLDHQTGGGDHPEIPERLTAVLNKLQQSLLAPMMNQLEPSKAQREWILKFHSDEYLFRFEEACLAGRDSIDHRDNQICYHSYEAAFLSAGAGPFGIDLLESGQGSNVFCALRPPGHHAEKAMALGFCFINNAVIAAHYWRAKYNRQKIFILDFDAHHGNGIQSAFEEDPQVFYASVHEHPTFSFPGTGYAEERGLGAGKGTTLNVPLLPGGNDQHFMTALAEKIEPAIDAFQPDAMIVSAGFDGHALDDMSGLAYTTTLFGQIGIYMNVWSKKYCQGRILSLLEGGYHLDALAAGVEAYIAGLCAIPPDNN